MSHTGFAIFTPMELLAQTPRTSPSQIFFVVGLLIGAAVVLGLVILLVRRKMLGSESSSAEQAGLMDQLRHLRDSGEITPEEFDAARRSMVARMTRDTPKPPKSSSE